MICCSMCFKFLIPAFFLYCDFCPLKDSYRIYRSVQAEQLVVHPHHDCIYYLHKYHSSLSWSSLFDLQCLHLEQACFLCWVGVILQSWLLKSRALSSNEETTLFSWQDFLNPLTVKALTTFVMGYKQQNLK